MRNTFCSREAELAETIPAEAEPICATQSCSKISPRVLWLLTWRPAGGALQDYQVCPSSLWADPAGSWQKTVWSWTPGPLITADQPAFQWPLSGISAVQSDRVCGSCWNARRQARFTADTAPAKHIIFNPGTHTRFGSRGCINIGTSWYFWHISKSCRDAVRIDPLRSFKRHDLFMKWQTYLCKLFFRAAFWVRAR